MSYIFSNWHFFKGSDDSHLAKFSSVKFNFKELGKIHCSTQKYNLSKSAFCIVITYFSQVIRYNAHLMKKIVNWI